MDQHGSKWINIGQNGSIFNIQNGSIFNIQYESYRIKIDRYGKYLDKNRSKWIKITKSIDMDQKRSKWIIMNQNKFKLNTCHDHFRHQPPDQRVICSFGISPSGGEKTPKRGDTGRIPARVPPPLLLQHPHC